MPNAISAVIRICIAATAIAAGVAQAQLIDRVDVQRRDNEAEISIQFTTPVQYLRHAPLDFGASLRIYTQLSRLPDPNTDLRRETKRLPATDMIPRFTLTYPEADGALSIAFDSPTRYAVRGGGDGRSIVVIVPVLPRAQDRAVQIKGTSPQVKPDAGQISAAPPAPNLQPAPTVPPSSPVSAAEGRRIDSIDVMRLGKQAEIRIRFTSPTRLARPTPPGTGESVSIFPQLLDAAKSSGIQGRETNRLEETDLVPHFSVSYPEADASLLVRFDQATRYSVETGPDDRSISIVVPALPGAKDFSLHVQGTLPGSAVASSMPAIPAAAPPAPAAAAVALVKPAAPAPAGSVVAPVAARPTPLAATVSSAPAGPTPIPAIAAVPSASVAVAAVPVTAVPTPSAVASAPAPLNAEVEARAKAAMAEAQRSLADRIGVIAAERLGQVLAMPPNSQSRLAQALIGEAHEYSGEPHKAKTEYELYLKRYPDGAEAARVKQRLAALDMGNAGVAAAAPAPSPQAASAPVASPQAAAAPLTPEGIEARAKTAMAEAQSALARRNGVIAAQQFGQVLALPPNSQSRLAQALIGEAREFSGELRRAKAEYEAYLKLYPGGAETARVKERLAALDKNIAQAVAATPGGSGLAKPAEWTFYGSISQYSYHGNSQIETITPPPPGQLTFNSDKLSLTDQNSIMTTLDLNARLRDGSRDTRLVLRDSDTHNYLQGQPQQNRLYSAYFEQTDKQAGYLVRAGRQTGNGGGVFGRFDGVFAGYNLNPSWRVNGVVGTPVEFGFPLKRGLQGLSVDRIPELNKIGYSLYYVEQPLEGFNDRKAVGAEARYFDPKRTAYAMLDYDVNFRGLNIAMVQGNWISDDQTNYFANADIRKSPPLGLLTAMPAQQVLDPFTGLPVFSDLRTQLLTAVSTNGLGELRSQASQLTGTSRFFTLGFMRPVTPKWQVGANYSLAYVTGTSDVGIMPAQPGSGASNVYSGTVLGTNLMLPNDTVVLNGSLIDNPTSFGQSYNVSYVIPYNAWRFDTILRYYTQKDHQDQTQARIAPTFKIVYRWRNAVSFEFEAGNEYVDETGPLREMHSRRRYFYAGYRWDFR